MLTCTVTFLLGLAAGTIATALIAWQWHGSVRDEIYEQGFRHGLENVRKYDVRTQKEIKR